MAFQTHVNLYPAIGVVGARASEDPISTVVAGQGGLCAGSAGANVGKFVWNTYATPGGPGVANNSTPSGLAPDGFIPNNQQALITTWLGEAGTAVPAGYNLTEMNGGVFFARNQYADASIGQKVYANLFTGDILGAATGAFPLTEVGTAAVIASATIGANTNNLVINTLTSGVPAIGALVLGLNIPGNTYIDTLGTFNGSVGTVTLTQNSGAVAQTAVALTTVPPSGPGGGVVVASANPATTTVTISSVTNGQVAAGQLAQGTGVPSGAYIASLGTFNGTSGTVVLSAVTTATVTAMNLSAFIETDWKILSAGNPGDIVKIGKLSY